MTLTDKENSDRLFAEEFGVHLTHCYISSKKTGVYKCHIYHVFSFINKITEALQR